MTEQKKPQAGEWWQHFDGTIGYVAGFDPEGDPVYVYRNGDSSNCDTMDGFCEDWIHLPDCTGWDWEPPANPVPGKKVATATMKCTPAEAMSCKSCGEFCDGKPISTCPDCGEFRGHGHEDVCPMAWVTQDRVPVRVGDQGQWNNGQTRWWTVDDAFKRGSCGKLMHGDIDPDDGLTLSVRCRRKDLPPVPEPVASPDDWVTQDRVPPRAGIDQVTWSDWEVNWVVAHGYWRELKHGMLDKANGSMLMVRCRRKDLPPVPKPTVDMPQQESPDGPLDDPLNWPHSTQPKRTTVRMFARAFDGLIYADETPRHKNDKEIKHDGYRFFVEGD